MSYWVQWGFQDSASSDMEEISFFHDFTMVVLLFILSSTLSVLLYLCLNKVISSKLLEGQATESLWTLLPALILIYLGTPSLSLLYTLDESACTNLLVKVIAHQWYWHYELNSPFSSNESEISPSSISVSANVVLNSAMNNLRMLDTDNRLPLPANIRALALITSADVLHSWAVPALGIKVDAIPGRLNQTALSSDRAGVYFGQCSEICGANHSYMPISIDFLSNEDFFLWV